MTIYNDIIVVTICIITEIKYLLKKYSIFFSGKFNLFLLHYFSSIDAALLKFSRNKVKEIYSF